jgi:hypothetical protein
MEETQHFRSGAWFAASVVGWTLILPCGLLAPYFHAGWPWERLEHVTRLAVGAAAVAGLMFLNVILFGKPR